MPPHAQHQPPHQQAPYQHLQVQQSVPLPWLAYNAQYMQQMIAAQPFCAAAQALVGAASPLLVSGHKCATFGAHAGSAGAVIVLDRESESSAPFVEQERAGTHSRGCPPHFCKLEKGSTHGAGCPTHCVLCKGRKGGMQNAGYSTHCGLCKESKGDMHGDRFPTHCPRCTNKMAVCSARSGTCRAILLF